MIAGQVQAAVSIKTHVEYLSSSALAGRMTGTRGEKLATAYVADYFKQTGLLPAGDKGSYFQAFPFVTGVSINKNDFSVQADSKKKIHYGRNVIAKLVFNDAAASTIVIGAHVDHLGQVAIGGMMYKGADDNASGVACMLEVAARLSRLKAQGKLSFNKNIIFSAWSGEELGILGSSYFVKHMQPNTVDAVINLDMVGHLDKHLVLQAVGSSTDWKSVINTIKNKHALNLVLQQDPYLPTDSTAFYLAHVPTLNFFTGANVDYHTPYDTADKLNYSGMEKISDFLIDLIMALENKPGMLAYANIPKPPGHLRDTLSIYLGTIPDYGSEDMIGVKLAGVVRSSPADVAHLKRADVIVELAGKKIQTIYDYTFALNALHANRKEYITVMRENKKLVLSIIPHYRK